MTILADSCCDLSPELLKKTQAKIAPLTITIDDTHYVDDGTVDIPPYLAAMKASKNPVRSACPSPDLYAEDIRATEGDCFIVTLSAKLSGSHNAASLGVQLAQEDMPEKKVHVFDSESASAGETYIALMIHDLIAAGKSFEQIVELVEEKIRSMHTLFVLDSLDNLVKNGRISRTVALLANVLNHRGLTFGYTTGVMGLGGGTTFGMHEVCYLEHYADDKSITETIFHEFAHCVGYGHAGNMTYEQTGPGWITLCNNVYVALSLDKELPVYSRRFLHTRWSRNRYFDDIYVASKHIIEDPELDALDGGLSPLRGETDRGGNDGEPVAFKLDYTDLPGATGTTFRPKDVYVYGDTLYAVNDADNQYSVEVFGLAGGGKKHLGSIKEWKHGEATGKFGGRPNGITRANDKIYVTHEEAVPRFLMRRAISSLPA